MKLLLSFFCLLIIVNSFSFAHAENYLTEDDTFFLDSSCEEDRRKEGRTLGEVYTLVDKTLFGMSYHKQQAMVVSLNPCVADVIVWVYNIGGEREVLRDRNVRDLRRLIKMGHKFIAGEKYVDTSNLQQKRMEIQLGTYIGEASFDVIQGLEACSLKILSKEIKKPGFLTEGDELKVAYGEDVVDFEYNAEKDVFEGEGSYRREMYLNMGMDGTPIYIQVFKKSNILNKGSILKNVSRMCDLLVHQK